MEQNGENQCSKQKKCTSSIVLYSASIVVAVIAAAYLAINIRVFVQTVSQYVQQGYPSGTVLKQLIPMQLLPGIFQPVGIYGGIALILFGIGKINEKLSKCSAEPTETLNDTAVIEDKDVSEKAEEAKEEKSGEVNNEVNADL